MVGMKQWVRLLVLSCPYKFVFEQEAEVQSCSLVQFKYRELQWRGPALTPEVSK